MAAELARIQGRTDWWNIESEHNAWEWAAQRVLWMLYPWGEKRQDVRSAWHTAHTIAATSHSKIENAEFASILQSLQSYLIAEEQPEGLEADPAILERMRQHAGDWGPSSESDG